ncbi:hypothetical protein V6N13_130278 [Hibiscus sabdariffa]
MEKPKRKERKKPKVPAQQRPAQAENISGRYLTAGNSCKSAADFPARKQLAVKSVHGQHCQIRYGRCQEQMGRARLARQPDRANYNWVLEFYANNTDGEDFSIVCGRRVLATAATINALLGLPNDDPSFYAMLGGFEEEDFEVIKDFLCQAKTE